MHCPCHHDRPNLSCIANLLNIFVCLSANDVELDCSNVYKNISLNKPHGPIGRKIGPLVLEGSQLLLYHIYFLSNDVGGNTEIIRYKLMYWILPYHYLFTV